MPELVPEKRPSQVKSEAWTLVAEVESAIEHKRSTKWIITLIAAAATDLVTTGENTLFRTSHDAGDGSLS